MVKKQPSSCDCPIYGIIDFCSKKWAMHILRAIAESKKMRFCEFKEALPDINSRILSERLTELESQGLINRTVIDEKPISIEYSITKKGQDLQSVFRCFCDWGKKWG